jgi:hypothetical protein
MRIKKGANNTFKMLTNEGQHANFIQKEPRNLSQASETFPPKPVTNIPLSPNGIFLEKKFLPN